jgi:hypothetical protein
VSWDDAWPWLSLALLGAYHGINPAMGWLFAVSQGMQNGSRRAVLRALGPIALGHEASIVLVAGVVIFFEEVVSPAALHVGAAAVLFAFGIFRFVKPRAHWRWTTMRVSGRELTLWSFLMSTAHGAGVMVAPVLIGAGSAEAAAADINAHDKADAGIATAASLPADALVIMLHVGAMLVVMGVVAVVVYEKVGVEILRKAWVNTDRVWAAAFILAAAATLFTA